MGCGVVVVVGCISSRAADKETLICPAQHQIASPDILVKLNLDCDKIEVSKSGSNDFHQARCACDYYKAVAAFTLKL